MSEKPGNHGKLLILANTKEDVTKSLAATGEFRKSGRTVVILGLDFPSWIELRRRNFPYKTPADYFVKERCAKIDLEAIRLAHVWYKPIENKITYHGICLGEIAEYDFAFLFIDALRSIEIANSVIDLEKPNEIWLSENIPMRNPNTVRYEALPKAITYLAKTKGIDVSYIKSEFAHGNNKSKKISFINFVLKTIYGIKRPQVGTEGYYKNNTKIVFVNVSSEIFLPIKKELDKNQRYIVINVNPNLTLNRAIVATHIQEYIEIWQNLKNDPKNLNSLSYNNFPLVNILTERFSKFFSDESLKIISTITEIERFVKNEKPDIVIIMEDISPSYRAIVSVCKKSGIPTLVIQHGATVRDMRGFHVMPVVADKQAVWGKISKEWAIERGKLPETQVITGNPRYDLVDYLRNKSHERFSVYRKLGLDYTKGFIVIATSWYAGTTSCDAPEDEEQFLFTALKAASGFPEKQIVIKLHPAYFETFGKLAQGFLNELHLSNVVVTKSFLWELLSTCDVIITRTSTVGLEAMLFDKAVITFCPKESSSSNPYAGTGAVIEACTQEELRTAIKNALYDKSTQEKLVDARTKFVQEYAYFRDGKASKRVALLIQQMIAQN